MGNDIVSTSRENLEQFIRERVKGSDLNRRYLCDYVDSSMACNVSLCKIANDTLYGRGFTVAQRDNPMRRTATYGHAIELVNIVDNVEISLGAYTIIIDRYAEKSMGYDKKEYPNILILEGESNSDTGASSLHAYTNPESSGSQFANETEYINEGFKVVYPPTNEAAYDFADAKALVNFVDLASEDDFKDTFESYFNKESVLKYYLFCLCFASVDTLAKNLHFARYTDVWYILPYDLDSVLGGSNVGFLNISSSCEVGNVYDEKNPEVIVEPNQFNSWNGRLWARIRNIFAADLTAMWTTLRSNGTFNYDNFIKYFDEIWDAIPPTMYNSSQQIKYIDYGTTGQVALHGNRKHQIKKFLRERIAYLDSKFGFYSDGGAENYANIRMNVLGDVSLTIETYYPVYYTIKWATNNIETHRIAKNTKYTFSYFSDVSTDREVLLYLPHTLKSIENLDSLQPASIDVSKATKLTKLEVHSEKLYSVNVTNNKYLRTIDFNGCKLLGTDTISTLSILYAKYLKYLDVRGTQLTAVNFSPQGGSIVDCYLPNTITSLTVQNQLLLTNLIIPGGENTPRDLATVTIDNCPLITKLSDTESSYPFDVFKYCRTLNINNSFLTMNQIIFDGFTRLQSVSLSNMESLTDLGLNDLCVKGETSTLRYIGISSCKNLTELSLNCTSNNYEIAFANSSLLDLSTSNVTELRSNCVMKGLNTIVLPVCIENMYFTNEYGTGYSDVKNIWSASTAVVDTSGVFPVARHMNYNTNIVDEYEGIDFYGLHLYNIDLGALVNIPDAINFSLYPTSVNPNFNLNRDGVEHPFLQPTGVLDLSDYTESLAKFFNGVDLDKLYVACRKDLPQTDLSYCFYGSSFSSPSRLNNVLNHIITVSNMEYCFYGTSTSNIDVLNSVNFLPGTSLRYCFAGCPNITELSDVTLSGNIGDASYMFSGSGLRSINNVSTSCGTIIGMFSNCDDLVEVNNFTASATTSYESLFEGCGGMTVAPIVEIPSTIVNISKMYKNCSSLVSIDGMVLHGNIIDTTEFIAGCNNLINANNVTIAGSFYNDIFRGVTSIKYVNNLLISYVGRSMSFAHMFDGCSNLVEMSFHDNSYVKDVISMDYMFAGTSMRTVDFSNVNFEKIVSYKYMFADCLMEEFSFTVPRTITSIQGFLSNCVNLKTLRNFKIESNVSVTDWLLNTPVENLIDCTFYNTNSNFKDVTTLKKVENLTYNGNNFSNYFEGCTSLETVTLTLTNNLTKASGSFKGCTSLKSIKFLEDTDLSNLTTFSDVFNGDTNLSSIINLKITNSSTISNNQTLVGCPINKTDGLYINSNQALNMFRMGKNSAITKFTDFEFGESAYDLHELFMDYPLLIEDIKIPSHASNVSNMFKNCIRIENVNSNWNDLYDRNLDDTISNDVITKDCYSNCDNIRYVDGELYMNEYGELTAMKYIPTEWGGKMSFDDDQTSFDIKLTDPNNLSYSMLGDVGEYLTNWGDGTEDMSTSHIYNEVGIYTIITRNVDTFGNGEVLDSSITSPIVRFRFLNKSKTNGSHLFDGWSNLLQIDRLEGNTFNSYDYMFNNCINLVDVDLSGCTLSQTVTTVSNMCNGCIKFTKTPILIIPDTVKDITNLFANSGIVDISGLVFGKNISTITNWRLNTPIVKANNITIKNKSIKLNYMTALKECNAIVLENVTDMSGFFEGDISLISAENMQIPNTVTTLDNGFKKCKSLTSIGLIIPDSVKSIKYLFDSCLNLKDISGTTFGSGITDSSYWYGVGDTIAPITTARNITLRNSVVKFNNIDTLKYIEGLDVTPISDISILFENCDSLLEDFIFPSNITKCISCFNGCHSITNIHSNWNNSYNEEIESIDCYANCTGITYIDGENVTSDGSYGLDHVPEEWGGGDIYDRMTWSIQIDATYLTNGTYTLGVAPYKINWGDGTIESNSKSHTYEDTTKKYNVRFKYRDYIPDDDYNYESNSPGLGKELIKVYQVPARMDGPNKGLSFRWASNLQYVDLSNLESVRNIGSCFDGCRSLTTIVALENLFKANIYHISHPTNFGTSLIWSNVFLNCRSLKYIDTDIIGKYVKYCTNLDGFFNGCTNIQTNIDLSSWDISSVTSMKQMFYGTNIATLDMSNCDVSKCTNMWNFVYNCTRLSSFHAPKNITAEYLGDFTKSTLLTSEHLMSIINNLVASETTKTLTLGSANLAKLNDTQIGIAVNKGWTVV